MPHYGLTQEGAATTIRADAVCTSSYVASSIIDLLSHDSVSVGAIITTTGSETISLKFQWSLDPNATSSSRWFDEIVLINGSASGGEQPQTFNSKVINFSGGTAGNIYHERFRRSARYFRVLAKSSGTTATLSIIAKPAVNCN